MTLKTAKVGGAVTQYEYDAENKLVRVVSPSNTATYRYDGLGRRVEKEVIAGTTTVTKYVYDNEDILLELDGSNNITARYTHGPGIDEPLVMEKGGQSFFYHADGLGSATDITDSTGTLRQQYVYSSFGKIESQLDPSFVQPYTFTSREFDPETGLYFYRHRTLDPLVGRFLQEDPILNASDPQLPYLLPRLLPRPTMLHRHSYVGNNVVNFKDPQGLAATCSQQARNFLFTCIAVIAVAADIPLSAAILGCLATGPAAATCTLATTAILDLPVIVGSAMCVSEYLNRLEKCRRDCPREEG